MKKLDLVLRHYNKLKPITCTVISGDTSKLFTVKINENENKEAEMVKGDPVLIGIMNSNDTIHISGGSVISATPQDNKYIICFKEVVNIDKALDQREFDRYPVSILGDIKLMDSNRRESACIKDISYSGMCLFSAGDYSINDIVEVTLYLSNNVSKYDGMIIRKAISYGRNEYGIQIIHRDKITMDATRIQIFNYIQNEKELMYRHLLSSNLKI